MEDVGPVDEEAPGGPDDRHLAIGQCTEFDVERGERDVLAPFVGDDPGGTVVCSVTSERKMNVVSCWNRPSTRGTTRLWLP